METTAGKVAVHGGEGREMTSLVRFIFTFLGLFSASYFTIFADTSKACAANPKEFAASSRRKGVSIYISSTH